MMSHNGTLESGNNLNQVRLKHKDKNHLNQNKAYWAYDFDN